jgi:hypothetical protein
MENQEVNLNVTVAELNAVLNALQEAPMPYRVVDALLKKLVSQAQAQLQPPAEEKVKEE